MAALPRTAYYETDCVSSGSRCKRHHGNLPVPGRNHAPPTLPTLLSPVGACVQQERCFFHFHSGNSAGQNDLRTSIWEPISRTFF